MLEFDKLFRTKLVSLQTNLYVSLFLSLSVDSQPSTLSFFRQEFYTDRYTLQKLAIKYLINF